MGIRLVHAGLLLAACVAIGARGPAWSAVGTPALTAEFAAARDRIQPRPVEELWKTIPWKTSLLEARQVAARVGKPLFVWSMDGHPLCLG